MNEQRPYQGEPTRKSIRVKRQKTLVFGKRTMKRLRCRIVMVSLTYPVHGHRNRSAFPSIDIYLN